MVRGGICARLSAPVSYEQPMTITRDFALDAKYRREEGLIFLSGIQALVRLPLDQHRADRRRGLNTATLISGYRGSPLGGLDLTLERNPDLLREHNVVFISGLNEDLGATAIYGSQLANLFPRPKYDGVVGMWYGKGPGVDRTGDVFKHANFAGVGRHGGVLALAGDDPLSKSSTLPTHSEIALYDAQFPILFPGSVQEILDLGRLGFELSRYSGLWVGFKIVTNVADEIGTAQVAPGRITVVDPGFQYEGKPWRHTQNPMLLPPYGLEMEREIHYGRLEAAKAFAAANGINRLALDARRVAQLGATRLGRKPSLGWIPAREALRGAMRGRPAGLTLARPAYFCSGCPHNRSTVVPEGSMAAAGIGCHGMALAMDRRTFGLTHMGGEGAQWVGMAPFTETPHIFQNLGDGTFFHSGSLAIRQAIAAGTNVTYKILYNSAVAMTGGQDAAGAMPGAELTRVLEAEGAKRIVVVTDEPEKYGKGARWASGVEVWHRDRLDAAQRLLRGIPGVTVLLYDQRCAAEKRRLRKRGKLPDPAMRVFINEAVCEGCGDCGVKSNCLSVQPVETEFGRKTQIHQSSCNKDYSCLNGDCPSFLTVVPRGTAARKARRGVSVGREPPPPPPPGPRDSNGFMMGIGGPGGVAVHHVLGTAARLCGKDLPRPRQNGPPPQ